MVEASTSTAPAVDGAPRVDAGTATSPDPKAATHCFDVPIVDLRDQRPPSAPPRGARAPTPGALGSPGLPPGAREGIYGGDDLAAGGAGLGAMDLRGLTPRSAAARPPPPPQGSPAASAVRDTPASPRSPASPGGGFGAELNVCDHCGKNGAEKRCGRCWTARYCGENCQREAWLTHKTACRRRPKPTADEDFSRKHGPKVDGVPVAATTTFSLCARCHLFDQTKEPEQLLGVFAISGKEVLADDYGGDSSEHRGRHTCKERGVERTKWKCVCKGCNRAWFCLKSVDPDGVFDAELKWTANLEAFKKYDRDLAEIDPRDPRQEGGPRMKV